MSATLEPRHVKAISRNRRVAGADPEKRHQILEGAHAVFTARGFDAASMNDIASAANVSKGTLYVYFEDKEHLFVALIEREREKQKQGMYAALAEEPDLTLALTNFGSGLVRLLTNPFALSAHRIVLGVAERMPDLGREFYERGPMQGAQQLAAFLARRVEQGELAIANAALAAAQFVDLSQSTLMRPRLFNAERVPPTEDEIAYVVGEAVATFMARYGAKKA
ncbi:TetR/AcrR family transcriptional regulator [Bosea sp. CCNWLW174]|uniref:TetR/AcrR family transcriptional regulator n=1 Tax=unclassified Bosea (in: a-proteobacteria) TaxID=2653178 RepID=UPI003014D860